MLLCFKGLVQAPVDGSDLIDPPAALSVFQLHDLFIRPVKVIGNIGYLLKQTVRGVAYSSPEPPTSTSNFVSHAGQVTLMRL